MSVKKLQPGKIVYRNNTLHVLNFSGLSQTNQDFITNLSKRKSVSVVNEDTFDNLLVSPINRDEFPKYAREISNCIKASSVARNIELHSNYSKSIDFNNVLTRATTFSNHIKNHKEEIATALSQFETYNVILDEIERSIDHLENLDKNSQYFDKMVNKIVSFLPQNQPLYALVCFGLVQTYLSETVYIRPPEIVQPHFKKLVEVLEIDKYFPNLHIHFGDRPSYFELTKGDIDAIIFTGQPENGKQIYRKYKPKLFILNGAGHNPIVVGKNADIRKSVESTLRVALQNQGQDCAAPNAILVHQSKLQQFKQELLTRLRNIEERVGDYSDRNNIVGPNSNPDAMLETFKLLKNNSQYCIYGGEVNIRNNIIKPTVFEKPLINGASYEEFYAPIIMIQPYKQDSELKTFFENPRYYANAMYVTIFGESKYVDSLAKTQKHKPSSIIRNTDLHKTERGFLPYGGLGKNASCVYLNDKKIPGETLPQRDIYNYLINKDFKIPN